MTTRIYIGRLTSRTSERDVEHFFRGYGRIRDIVLKNGFGFVEFDDRRDAYDAIHDLNGKDLGGDRVILDFSKPRGGGNSRGRFGGGRFERGPPRRESRYGRPMSTRHRVLVENLSTRISWQDLKDEVRRNGIEATYAEAHKAKANEGLLCFANHDDLKKCIEKCDGLELNGRKIKMIDDSEAARSRSRSRERGRRSRSRDSSRSRSRSRSPKRNRSKSSSRSRSRSKSSERKSRSPSPAKKSPSPRKRSASPRKRSNSPKKRDDRSRSASPMEEDAKENGDN
ncbi:unnamed protein product [Caenorhabditis bovis]|uniref:RRM domain-containing protein n=1 Tax=Caenorhabditis bovis TaxID=2654633 RepID=A0A8S1EWH8_9PELO|nr:unnamed protein product [Caenorhabditis bovis]